MNILLISDIHGNYPALAAIDSYFQQTKIDLIINCGDSTVYAPFPNETLEWLQTHKAVSILGNTDKKVIKLLQGKTIKKPGKEEKRQMYYWTARALSAANAGYLQNLSVSRELTAEGWTMGVFHGSPEKPHEFLFPDTADQRFQQLAAYAATNLVIIGHSHTPFHIVVDQCHFINPGSVGRMFDGDPSSSCALLTLTSSRVQVNHFRICYPVQQVVTRLKQCNHPAIYQEMYQRGKKLN